jgi:hypothetical protein
MRRQIHTHMCYSEFNDIIEAIAAMDADVITIETSRSAMELLDVFDRFAYPNQIGPGVYDIHSPNVPSTALPRYLAGAAARVHRRLPRDLVPVLGPEHRRGRALPAPLAPALATRRARNRPVTKGGQSTRLGMRRAAKIG